MIVGISLQVCDADFSLFFNDIVRYLVRRFKELVSFYVVVLHSDGGFLYRSLWSTAAKRKGGKGEHLCRRLMAVRYQSLTSTMMKKAEEEKRE